METTTSAASRADARTGNTARTRRKTRSKTLAATLLAVTATAVTGSLATRSVSSPWYRNLRKPSWQPPSPVFGLVWTPLYGLIAVGAARALDRREGGDRTAFAGRFATNLVLNAGWSLAFFGARSPRLALAEIFLLNASNAALIRQAWRTDRAAGAILLPYGAWTLFATALNTAIVRRNPADG
ncbi:tryptophan-rich sensory protein [Planobispora rosea]|uniref:Tryptophan-rich sensory protein n=1 Tax=Planobispora rosea TaxID=35762 RepID=A0A8J3S544_PLARO|nr:TspO/MBR family protein [Planobispora rosea]GGS83899.1 tryptophan-rich sensory protein [Planobispora rosea]GIH86290.1 tryptophan-rich sensory protein [Planobispora rosea]